MDSGVFLTQKSSSSSSSYIAAGSGWAGWACAHPDFARVDKRTETEIDNMYITVCPLEFSSFRHLWALSNDSRATLTFNKYLNGSRVLCRNAFIAPNTRQCVQCSNGCLSLIFSLTLSLFQEVRLLCGDKTLFDYNAAILRLYDVLGQLLQMCLHTASYCYSGEQE